MVLKHTSTKELWQALLDVISKNGSSYKDHDGRICVEQLNISLCLTDFSDISYPIEVMSRSKKWVYPKPQEIENFVLDGNLSPSYAYSYGERLFMYPGKKSLNQIDSYVIPLLKKSAHSRRAIASIWNPDNDSDGESLVPSLLYVDFKIRDDSLHVTTSLRSCDCFIGFPANVYELYVLAKYVAKRLDIGIGSLTLHLNSGHFFKEYSSDMKSIIS